MLLLVWPTLWTSLPSLQPEYGKCLPELNDPEERGPSSISAATEDKNYMLWILRNPFDCLIHMALKHIKWWRCTSGSLIKTHKNFPFIISQQVKIRNFFVELAARRGKVHHTPSLLVLSQTLASFQQVWLSYHLHSAVLHNQERLFQNSYQYAHRRNSASWQSNSGKTTLSPRSELG